MRNRISSYMEVEVSCMGCRKPLLLDRDKPYEPLCEDCQAADDCLAGYDQAWFYLFLAVSVGMMGFLVWLIGKGKV